MLSYAIININSEELVGYRNGFSVQHAVDDFVTAFPKFEFEKEWLTGVPEREWNKNQLLIAQMRLEQEQDEYARGEQERYI